MVDPSLSFLSIDWFPKLVKQLLPLAKHLADRHDKRSEELRKIGDTFGSPFDLARYYVEPHCQDHNPVDYNEDQQLTSASRESAFSRIDTFLKGDFPLLTDGSRQLFILSDAGMGKTSLLMMIRLTHLLSFWPRGYDCQLLKIGEDTLDMINGLPNKANTVLLLDALDEDPLTWGNTTERALAILDATVHYRRVIISCRT
uniref:NACHT domain-containing protein n=1 Tax=Candidatus Kentrum sp. TUN TaxID=2126343 RepID=A0A450ZMR4_9GAMM|nr:MAG: hypothetical protein BECKTUN1418D_GA0071000_10277 [Candidatus Kentron sp. TUN]